MHSYPGFWCIEYVCIAFLEFQGIKAFCFFIYLYQISTKHTYRPGDHPDNIKLQSFREVEKWVISFFSPSIVIVHKLLCRLVWVSAKCYVKGSPPFVPMQHLAHCQRLQAGEQELFVCGKPCILILPLHLVRPLLLLKRCQVKQRQLVVSLSLLLHENTLQDFESFPCAFICSLGAAFLLGVFVCHFQCLQPVNAWGPLY